MATTRKENEGAIEAFNQAQARLEPPVILTVNCAKRRDDELTQITKDFDAAIDRMKKKSKACMDNAQILFDMLWVLTGCGLLGDRGTVWSAQCAADWAKLNELLYTEQTNCINAARDERKAAADDKQRKEVLVGENYEICCIAFPGSCKADAGTPQM